MKFLRKTTSGFTVLEVLIVLTIIIILLSIALPALERARVRSYNEKIVTDVKVMALGLEQFKQSCGEYPAEITAGEPCNDSNSEVTLREFIPVINDYSFNESAVEKGKVANILYFPFSTGNADFCTGFHIGAQLRDGGNSSNIETFVGDMDFNSDSPDYQPCFKTTNTRGFKGETNLFDIVRQ
jgi:general secretion pathway protein G